MKQKEQQATLEPIKEVSAEELAAEKEQGEAQMREEIPAGEPPVNDEAFKPESEKALAVIPETATARVTAETTAVSIRYLAAQERGIEIFEDQVTLFNIARRAALKATKATDWSLYKRKDGNITGFLDANGCFRIHGLLGIKMDKAPERERIDESGGYSYLFSGNVYCQFTDTIMWFEGGRSSTEKVFVEQKKIGLQLRMDVKKAAYKNFVGRATRQLAGMEAVPISELQEVGLDLGRMALARQYTGDERDAWAKGDYAGVIAGKFAWSGGSQGKGQSTSPPRKSSGGENLITEKQHKRFWAIAKKHEWSDADVTALLDRFTIKESQDIPMNIYNAIVDHLEKRSMPEPTRRSE